MTARLYEHIWQILRGPAFAVSIMMGGFIRLQKGPPCRAVTHCRRPSRFRCSITIWKFRVDHKDQPYLVRSLTFEKVFQYGDEEQVKETGCEESFSSSSYWNFYDHWLVEPLTKDRNESYS